MLTNDRVVACQRRFLVSEGLHGDSALCRTSYAKVSQALLRAATLLNVGGMQLRTHSFRRGGATALSLRGVSSGDIMFAGRWASARSCKLYIQRGELLILRYQASLTINQAPRIDRLASLGEHAFAACALMANVVA